MSLPSSPVSPSRRARLWRGSATVVFLIGAMLALSPLAQNAYTWWNQRQLRAAWDSSDGAAPKPKALAPHPRLVASRPVTVAPTPQISENWPSTRLVIPDIGVDAVVVEGVDDASLRRGPGHQPGTAFPGEDGNCVIAGHSNVYGSPFARINELAPGALIELRLRHQTVRYRALTPMTVNETDTSVLRPPPAGAPPRLTLLTCTVPHSWQRIVLLAEKEVPGVPY